MNLLFEETIDHPLPPQQGVLTVQGQKRTREFVDESIVNEHGVVLLSQVAVQPKKNIIEDLIRLDESYEKGIPEHN